MSSYALWPSAPMPKVSIYCLVSFKDSCSLNSGQKSDHIFQVLWPENLHGKLENLEWGFKMTLLFLKRIKKKKKFIDWAAGWELGEIFSHFWDEIVKV